MSPFVRFLKKYRYVLGLLGIALVVLLVVLGVNAPKSRTVAIPTQVYAADILDSQRENSAEALVMGETYGVVTVDGVAVASLATYEEAASVLDGVLAHFQSGASEIISYAIEEKIEARRVIGAPWNPVTVDGAVSMIVNGTEEVKTYTVGKGDSFWSIAKKVGMDFQAILAANPATAKSTLNVGDTVNIVEVKPMVHVTLTERVTVTESVGYGTIYEDNPSIYIGQYEYKGGGVRGQNSVTYEITSVNGTQTAKEKIDSVVISYPVTQVIYKGTKPLPNVIGTGVFRYPLDGTRNVNSAYGIYRSAFSGVHQGVDLSGWTGDNIYAVDDGVVTFAGTSGTYGNLIKLSHGNGYETYYAHCSKLYVTIGDTVKKGDVIGLVGMTGRATGPHLHFEVRYYGAAQNPLDYLP